MADKKQKFNGRRWQWLRDLEDMPPEGLELRAEVYELGEDGKPNMNALLAKFHAVSFTNAEKGKRELASVFLHPRFVEGHTAVATRIKNW